MKYRTKLYLSFGGLLIASVLLVEGVTYYESKKRFIQMMKMRALGIAATAARKINASEVETVKTQLNDKSPEFISLVHELRAIRDANRNNIFFVQYIYIIAPNPLNPAQIFVVADATEDAAYAPPGTYYPEAAAIGITEHLNGPFAPDHIVSDRWGRFLPGYAPILDENGKYVATLGLNIGADIIDRDLNRMKWIAFTSMMIALAAGFAAATFLANGLIHSLNRIRTGVTKGDEEDTEINIGSFSKDEFGDLARAIQTVSLIREEQDNLKNHFFRNVSQNVMNKILKGGMMPYTEGEKRKITVLCSDICNFTHFTEILTPEQVVSYLNEFFTVMYEVIFAHNGTVDKIIGDRLVVEFGAPLEDPSQEIHAVDTAVAMQEALRTFNEKWEPQGRPKIVMVIGIHSDQSILANIGPETRKEYTAVGHAVTTALRVRDAAKRLEVPILVSESTWIPARNRYESKDLGPLYLKGKSHSVKVYSIELPKE